MTAFLEYIQQIFQEFELHQWVQEQGQPPILLMLLLFLPPWLLILAARFAPPASGILLACTLLNLTISSMTPLLLSSTSPAVIGLLLCGLLAFWYADSRFKWSRIFQTCYILLGGFAIFSLNWLKMAEEYILENVEANVISAISLAGICLVLLIQGKPDKQLRRKYSGSEIEKRPENQNRNGRYHKIDSGTFTDFDSASTGSKNVSLSYLLTSHQWHSPTHWSMILDRNSSRIRAVQAPIFSQNSALSLAETKFYHRPLTDFLSPSSADQLRNLITNQKKNANNQLSTKIQLQFQLEKLGIGKNLSCDEANDVNCEVFPAQNSSFVFCYLGLETCIESTLDSSEYGVRTH